MKKIFFVCMFVLLLPVIGKAGTGFFNIPETNSDGTAIDWSQVAEIRANIIYDYAKSYTSLESSPDRILTIPRTRRVWCVLNMPVDTKVLYVALRLVYNDSSVSELSEPAFYLVGNLTGYANSNIDSARVDGQDVVEMGRLFNTTHNESFHDATLCPNYPDDTDHPAVPDLALSPVTSAYRADCNKDHVINGKDLTCLGRNYNNATR